jgi:hypothetical protein
MSSKTWEKREAKKERVPFDAVDMSVRATSDYVYLGISTSSSSISLSLDQAESLADELLRLVYTLRDIPKSGGDDVKQ